jgi:cell wall assembly regulator SMI1
MSRAAELLRSVAGQRWIDEDGNENRFELLPPLTDDEMSSLEEDLGFALPAEARALLGVTRGLAQSPLESVDFAGLGGGAILEEIFPQAVSIAHDGFGNYWVVDASPDSDVWGPIFFLCHDPAVVVYQCADAATFIEQLLELAEPPYKGPLDFVHEAAMRIWSGRETVIDLDAALSSAGPVLRAYAADLAPEFLIADFRTPQIGDGFSLKRVESLVRHPTERIFAFRRAEAGKLASMLRRLFRRGGSP